MFGAIIFLGDVSLNTFFTHFDWDAAYLIKDKIDNVFYYIQRDSGISLS